MAQVAQWSEAAGCEGLLVYTDNGIVDAWLVSQLLVQATEQLCPLVAVQALYMHPYAVAKMISSIAYLHQRRMYLNLVAGGFRNDLLALGDDTAHDDRYDRTVEYGQIINALVADAGPVSVSGRYYKVRNLRLTPPVPAACIPGMMISGSSPAGVTAARQLGATAIKYPQRSKSELGGENGKSGIRLGVITREDREQAWRVAYERFPTDRAGQIAHGLAMRVSDSDWHRQLSELARTAASEDDPYWLSPFENYATFCPYLVGDYQRISTELRRYLDLGFHTFILDTPGSEEDLHHIAIVFGMAKSSPSS